MFKKRNAQGLSITTIIIAVIGLIVVVVLVSIFSGRLGQFGRGLDDAKTCESVCTSQNLKFEKTYRTACNEIDGSRVLFGSFSDASGEIGTGDSKCSDGSGKTRTQCLADDPATHQPFGTYDEIQAPVVCCCT